MRPAGSPPYQPSQNRGKRPGAALEEKPVHSRFAQGSQETASVEVPNDPSAAISSLVEKGVPYATAVATVGTENVTSDFLAGLPPYDDPDNQEDQDLLLAIQLSLKSQPESADVLQQPAPSNTRTAQAGSLLPAVRGEGEHCLRLRRDFEGFASAGEKMGDKAKTELRAFLTQVLQGALDGHRRVDCSTCDPGLLRQLADAGFFNALGRLSHSRDKQINQIRLPANFGPLPPALVFDGRVVCLHPDPEMHAEPEKPAAPSNPAAAPQHTDPVPETQLEPDFMTEEELLQEAIRQSKGQSSASGWQTDEDSSSAREPALGVGEAHGRLHAMSLHAIAQAGTDHDAVAKVKFIYAQLAAPLAQGEAYLCLTGADVQTFQAIVGSGQWDAALDLLVQSERMPATVMFPETLVRLPPLPQEVLVAQLTNVAGEVDLSRHPFIRRVDLAQSSQADVKILAKEGASPVIVTVTPIQAELLGTYRDLSGWIEAYATQLPAPERARTELHIALDTFFGSCVLNHGKLFLLACPEERLQQALSLNIPQRMLQLRNLDLPIVISFPELQGIYGKANLPPCIQQIVQLRGLWKLEVVDPEPGWYSSVHGIPASQIQRSTAEAPGEAAGTGSQSQIALATLDQKLRSITDTGHRHFKLSGQAQQSIFDALDSAKRGSHCLDCSTCDSAAIQTLQLLGYFEAFAEFNTAAQGQIQEVRLPRDCSDLPSALAEMPGLLRLQMGAPSQALNLSGLKNLTRLEILDGEFDIAQANIQLPEHAAVFAVAPPLFDVEETLAQEISAAWLSSTGDNAVPSEAADEIRILTACLARSLSTGSGVLDLTMVDAQYLAPVLDRALYTFVQLRDALQTGVVTQLQLPSLSGATAATFVSFAQHLAVRAVEVPGTRADLLDFTGVASLQKLTISDQLPDGERNPDPKVAPQCEVTRQ